MADIKIGLIAPYKSLITVANEIAERKGINLISIFGAMEEAIAIAEKMCLNNIDVIVAREGTDKLIIKHVNVPIVPIKISTMDILKAIIKNNKTEKGLLLANYYEVYRDLEVLEKVINCSIKQIVFRNQEDLLSGFEAYDKEKYVLIGGGFSCKSAMDRGFDSILVESSNEWVEYALENALKVALSKSDEKEKRILLQTIVNKTEEGIIAINSNYQITVFNSVAENIFHLKAKEVIQKRNEFILMKTGLNKIIREKRENEHIEIIHKMRVLINTTPIEYGKNVYGGVCLIHDAQKIQKMEENFRFSLHSKGLATKNIFFENIIGQSRTIIKAVDRAKKFAKTDYTILITGESGTGKELFAHSIVNESKRRNSPYIAINCAAIPINLLEAELFGYEEGAFTGAKKGGKPGYFELVHNGTIFLDEIGKLNYELQGQMLRVIEQKEIIRIGGNTVIPVNVRIIAATNENIYKKVLDGEFREDLYYRLNVLQVDIPPLRERERDVLLISQYLLREKKIPENIVNIFTKTLSYFKDYPWKGNVRELYNVLTQLVILADFNRPLSINDAREMINEIMRHGKTKSKMNYEESKIPYNVEDKSEYEIISGLINEKKYSMKQIAVLFGISRSTLWRKIKKYKL